MKKITGILALMLFAANIPLNVFANQVLATVSAGNSAILTVDNAAYKSESEKLFEESKTFPKNLIDKLFKKEKTVSGDVYGPPPAGKDMSIETTKNTPYNGKLFYDGTLSENHKFYIIESNTMGTVNITDEKNGYFSYMPQINYVGYDSFSFIISDGDNKGKTGTVKILITEAPVQEIIYTDLTDHWAKNAANSLYKKDLIKGEVVKNKRFFYPDYTLNRIQFVVWANSVFVGQERNLGSSPFADLSGAPSWIVSEAKIAYDTGITKGSSENGNLYFNPYKPITRIEAATMVYNIIKPPVSPQLSESFSDYNEIPLWARDMVSNMINIGIIGGYDDNTLKPNKEITRAEAAILLEKAINYLENNSNTVKRKILK